MENVSKFQKGILKVSDEVIATIARLAALEVDGVVSLTKPSVDFKQLIFKNGDSWNIKVKLSDDVVEISISVCVKYGVNVVSVAEHIQENVKSNVQSMTGVMVSRVNISVADITFSGEDKTLRKQAL